MKLENLKQKTISVCSSGLNWFGWLWAGLVVSNDKTRTLKLHPRTRTQILYNILCAHTLMHYIHQQSITQRGSHPLFLIPDPAYCKYQIDSYTSASSFCFFVFLTGHTGQGFIGQESRDETKMHEIPFWI